MDALHFVTLILYTRATCARLLIHAVVVAALHAPCSVADGGSRADSPSGLASSFSSFSFIGGQPVGEIKEETLPLSPCDVQVLEYREKSLEAHSVDKSLERARSRLGEKKYNVLTNNCEHFVNWAKTGVSQSSQTQAGMYKCMAEHERSINVH